MKFRVKEFRNKKGVVKDSFDLALIHVGETTRAKAAIKPLDDKEHKGGQPTQSSPQKRGGEIHQEFKILINEGKGDATTGEILKEIKDKFGCDFIKAGVPISGYAVKRKTEVYIWSGKMDAVAIRRKNGDLEVFVVEWKTTDNLYTVGTNWWEGATHFKNSLYQCLVYRELLRAHLKHNVVNAKVGIILVPIHQKYPVIICPGLCLDFQKMRENLLLERLEEFEWRAGFDKSIYVHDIKLPRKLFKESLIPAFYVDESTNTFKEDTRLKDILNDDATVGDLCRFLGLPFIKRENIKKEDTTKEELEQVNKKCFLHVTMTAKFLVLNKPENNQHGVALSLFFSFSLLVRAKPTR